ncbi:class I SAM-dependent methyltransferase [Microseira sp. BLCC-F43]|uniref:class I SAM-dependent methyltransferase n=1 Tax=Microseira sp. BLCC-F43 TaxID=3153602 RepID=UPI0035BBFE6C
MNVCAICKNKNGNKTYVVKEMMFGFRDEFEYFECAECGCIQIKEIPEALSKYYPDNFYSFQEITSDSKVNSIESFLKRQRMKYLIYGNKEIGILLSKILIKIYKTPMADYYEWFRKLQLPLESEILDVGCGSGNLLLQMRSDGFTNLTGVDPFIKSDIFYENGVKVLKKYLHEIEGSFDFIMLNHAFEHMPQPLSVLKELYRIVNKNRYVLIRIPVASSFAWRKYGVNWVQIDAPRHFFLHTTKSMEILANKAGFKIADIVFDSHAFQFWGSEQILGNIAITESASYAVNPDKSMFSKEQIDDFNSMAKQLNKEKDGDAAGFYLYKA